LQAGGLFGGTEDEPLTALDRDVEIAIRGKPRSRKAGRMSLSPPHDYAAPDPQLQVPAAVAMRRFHSQLRPSPQQCAAVSVPLAAATNINTSTRAQR